MVPSLVTSHTSPISFHRRYVFADDPRLTSIPAFSVGAFPDGRSAFKAIILSPICKLVVLIYVVVPLIVKFPVTTTSCPNVALPDTPSKPRAFNVPPIPSVDNVFAAPVMLTVLLNDAAFWNVLSPANVCVVVSTAPLAVVLAELSRANGTVPVDKADALMPVVLVVSKTFASN